MGLMEVVPVDYELVNLLWNCLALPVTWVKSVEVFHKVSVTTATLDHLLINGVNHGTSCYLRL